MKVLITGSNGLLIRSIKEFLKMCLRKQTEIFQLFGLNILPHHFYSEVPTFSELKRHTSWKVPLSMEGINGSDINNQLDFLRSCCSTNFIERMRQNNIYSYAYKQNKSAGYGQIESDFLYCFVSTLKHKKIIQIGAGFSTAIIKLANIESNHSSFITCIDPYPNDYLKKLSGKNEIELLADRAQNIPIDLLTNLNEGDLLFIDSTHTVKPGSEVNKIIFEVLPRLKKGVFVHFHDIYFPYDYQRGILSDELFFHNESNLLYAYLLNNPKYEISVSLSMLHYSAPDKLKAILVNYKSQLNDHGLRIGQAKQLHFPSSTYLRVIN